MPIAKKVLRVGFTVVALPGGYITKEAVKANGWENDVEDGPDLVAGEPDKDDKAPKGKAQKGS